MTYFEIFKKIISDFKQYIGNQKFYLMVFVLLLTTILGSSEPFFGAKMIEYIENFFQNQTSSFNHVMIFM
jgi:hypothetical protein